MRSKLALILSALIILLIVPLQVFAEEGEAALPDPVGAEAADGTDAEVLLSPAEPGSAGSWLSHSTTGPVLTPSDCLTSSRPAAFV